jgi:hypothetical protein
MLAVDLMHGHAPLDATVDGARLVLRKVVAGLGAQQDEDFLQRPLAFRRRVACRGSLPKACVA